MGCGKSKHEDVASGNTTVLQRKKSSVSFKTAQENIETETQDNINNNNVSSVVEVEQKESESFQEFGGVESNKDDDVKGEAEKTNVQEKEVADAAAAAEGNTKKAEKDDSLIESDQKINDAAADDTAEEEKLAENKGGGVCKA